MAGNADKLEPHLSDQERRVVDALHHARATVRAPESLRARIAADRPSAASTARRRLGYAGGLAGALAAVVLALVLILPAGTPVGPSVSQAAGLALRGPATGAPAPDPRAPLARLGQDVQDLYFPNWSLRFGWRAVGQRIDKIDGRLFVTVYYQWRGEHADRIAYTIAATPPLKAPSAQTTTLNGTVLRTLMLDGRRVVTWQRAGHTCVLSGAGVSAAVLQRLAAWQVPGEGR